MNEVVAAKQLELIKEQEKVVNKCVSILIEINKHLNDEMTLAQKRNIENLLAEYLKLSQGWWGLLELFGFC